MDYSLPDGAPTLDQLEDGVRLALWRVLDETYPLDRLAAVQSVAQLVAEMRRVAPDAAPALDLSAIEAKIAEQADTIAHLQAAAAHHEGYLTQIETAMAAPLKSTETVAGLRAWALGVAAVPFVASV